MQAQGKQPTYGTAEFVFIVFFASRYPKQLSYMQVEAVQKYQFNANSI